MWRTERELCSRFTHTHSRLLGISQCVHLGLRIEFLCFLKEIKENVPSLFSSLLEKKWEEKNVCPSRKKKKKPLPLPVAGISCGDVWPCPRLRCESR